MGSGRIGLRVLAGIAESKELNCQVRNLKLLSLLDLVD